MKLPTIDYWKEKDLFLQTNDRVINLKKVSNINILKDRKRIVFNLNYQIEIVTDFDGYSKYISDYVYWDSISQRDLEDNLKYLQKSEYFQENFLKQKNGDGFININEISSIKFSDKKNRVIFNLSHPITFKDYEGVERITSEFVYVNCRSISEYRDYCKYVKDIIGI